MLLQWWRRRSMAAATAAGRATRAMNTASGRWRRITPRPEASATASAPNWPASPATKNATSLPLACQSTSVIKFNKKSYSKQKVKEFLRKVASLGRTTPKNCPFPSGDPAPHLIHGSLGAPNSNSQTASLSLQPF